MRLQLASDNVQGQDIYSHLRQWLSDGLQEAGHGKGEHRGASHVKEFLEMRQDAEVFTR